MIWFKDIRKSWQDPKAEIRNAVTCLERFARSLPEQERLAVRAQLIRIELALKVGFWKRIQSLLLVDH